MRFPSDDRDMLEQLSLSAEKILHQLGQRAIPSVLSFSESDQMFSFWQKYDESLNQFFLRVNAWCELNLPYSIFVLFWRDDSMVLFYCGMFNPEGVIKVISKKGHVNIDLENELVFQCFKGYMELCKFGQFNYQGEA